MSFLKNSTFLYKNIEVKDTKNQLNNLCASVSPTSNSITCNSHSVAYFCNDTNNTNTVCTVSLKGTEHNPTIFKGHSAKITDISFSLYDPNILVSSSFDGSVKIWNVPVEDDNKNIDSLNSPLHTLNCFEGPVNCLSFHPSASYVLAIGGKKTFSVVDVEQGEILTQNKLRVNREVISLDWNCDGSQTYALNKAKELLLFDSREEENSQKKVKLNMRTDNVIHLYDHYLLVSAQNDLRQPLVRVYDTRNLSNYVIEKLTGFSSGQTLTSLDFDSKLLLLTTRGSSSVDVIDLNQGLDKFQRIQKYFSDSIYQGFCALPKYVLDLDQNEIIRILKLTSSSIEPIRFIMPRKIQKFDPKLYPNSRAENPSITTDDWFNGENSLPNLLNIDPTLNNFKSKRLYIDRKVDPDTVQSTTPFENQNDEKPSLAGLHREEKTDDNEDQENFVYQVSETRKKMDKTFHHSPFLHTFGIEPKSFNSHYYGLKPQATESTLPLHDNIQVNSKYFAIPWKTISGGGLFIKPLSDYGRTQDDIHLIRGHSSHLSSFSLSPTVPNLVATGDLEGVINTWRFPEDKFDQDLKEPDMSSQYEGKIRKLKFHNSIKHLLAVGVEKVCSGSDLFVFDTSCESDELLIEGHGNIIWDIAWSICDGSILATTCKDKFTRVIDPRSGSIVHSFKPPEGDRDTRVIWTDDPKKIITCGFSKQSTRMMSLWDLRYNTAKSLSTVNLGVSNSNSLPFYSQIGQLLFVTFVGENKFRIFTLKNGLFTEMTGWNNVTDQFCIGIAQQSYETCDIMNVEIIKILRLTQNSVFPITFKVPRKRKEFFQDDLFTPINIIKPSISADEWLNGKDVRLESVDLQPKGTHKLSEAPEEDMTEMQKRRIMTLRNEQKKQTGNAPLSQEEAIDKWSKLTYSSQNRWDAVPQGPQDDVNDDEWSD